MKNRPNILLLMTDQLRGDCLGYAGHPDVKTPYLDTLASRGVFSTTHTAPARAALRRWRRFIQEWRRITMEE